MEGSIVNQIEISGFSDEKEAQQFRKKIKSLKSNFNLKKISSNIDFIAEEASWKIKDDNSLVFLFITEDFSPENEIKNLSELLPNLKLQHLVISPSGSGLLKHLSYENGELVYKNEVEGSLSQMLGDLIKGGFQ